MSLKQVDVHIFNTEIESTAGKELALSVEVNLTTLSEVFKEYIPDKKRNACNKIFPFCWKLQYIYFLFILSAMIDQCIMWILLIWI